MNALKTKVDIEGDYLVRKTEAKAFLYGNIYLLVLTLEKDGTSTNMEGLLYHDHISEELHLIYWKEVSENNIGKCLSRHETTQVCLTCENNAPIVDGKCLAGVPFC